MGTVVPYPRWKAAGYVPVDKSIQVWRPVVEIAWREHSSSLHMVSASLRVALPAFLIWLEYLTLSVSISFSMTPSNNSA